MNTLILLSENKEHFYYAVKVPMDASAVFLDRGNSYGEKTLNYLTFCDPLSISRISSKMVHLELVPDSISELLGVFGEIPKDVLSEIYGIVEPYDHDPIYGEFLLWKKGIDLATSKVCIIRTKKS